MLNKKTLLFLAISSIIMTSCKPTVIQEDTAKFLAACAGQPRWVANELYNHTIQKYENALYAGNDNERGDIIYEPGDDMWNLQVLKEDEDDFGDKITENDLYEFISNGVQPESNASYNTAFANAFFGAALGMGNQMKSKTRAFKTASEVCNGNFDSLKDKICKQVEVYDYREDKMSSTKKVTVYDVVYKVNDKHYVWCSVSDLGDTFEVNYVNDSELFSNLGF